MDKIALLTQILSQNPTDAFARYGLAMAYAAENNTDQALTEFSILILHNPDYVPAYQMSAQTLAKLNRPEEAIARLQEGLAAAQRTHNAHAASEMQALLDDLTT
jgi:predicted Zn-dependent protease